MPTRDEILQGLVNEVAILRSKVAALEDAQDPWGEEFPVHGEKGADVIPQPQEGEHVPAPLLAASGPRDPNDPIEDTPEVLEAKRRIEQANANDLQPVLHTQEIQVTPGSDETIITVPAPSKQQVFMRKGNAKRVIANLPGLDHEAATAAYIEGGPLWLHAFDRHHVVELPYDLRQQFIRDLALTVPESAQELARDILKVTDPEVQSAWAHDNMETVKQEADWRSGG